VARLSPLSLVGDTGRAERDDGAAAVGDCGLPLTPFYGTAVDERYLGAREERARERENRIMRICMRLADRGSAERA
jgi:hypothetical protein